MQYKDGKIIQIIQEFSVLGNTYNLNGIDLINAVFFVREDRKKFRLLLPAEYKITVDGTNVNLEIQDGVLNNCISVQVGIDLNKLFDLYDPVGSPDIVVLKDKYNQLCQDMANLWEYVKKQGVSSDALNRDIVLPILKEGETYVMLNGSLEATPLVTAETELQKLLDELVEKSQEVLNGYVEALEETLKKNLLEFIESEKQNFVTFDDESTETETGIIQIANNSEALSATNNTKAITPLKMKQYIDSVFSGYVGETGYKKFNEGFIIQWGLIVTTGNYFTVTLPISFPQGKYQVLTTDSGSGRNAYGANPLTKNTFNLYGPSTSWSARWIAVGY